MANSLRTWASSTKVRIAFRLKTVPSLFLTIAHLREDSKKTVVRRDSDVAIEGYWRCGNHYATYAFMVAQANPPRVAHHFHAPAQLTLARRWNVPAILLIRNPVDAVASSTVYLEHSDPTPLLKCYNVFHEAVLPLKDQLVVSDFAETIGDFGEVIQRVNAMFDRDFDLFYDTPENRRRVEDLIHQEHEARMGADAAKLPLPSDDKARLKEAVIDRIHAPACAPLLAQATQLYDSLRAAAKEQRETHRKSGSSASERHSPPAAQRGT